MKRFHAYVGFTAGHRLVGVEMTRVESEIVKVEPVEGLQKKARIRRAAGATSRQIT